MGDLVMYKEINDRCVQRLSDNAFIPRDLDSNAYKAYLEWKQAQPQEPELNTTIKEDLENG